jgi:hypothetical protein
MRNKDRPESRAARVDAGISFSSIDFTSDTPLTSIHVLLQQIFDMDFLALPKSG